MDIRTRIRRCAAAGTLPHAIVFSGTGDRESAARYAAAAMECTGGQDAPCGQCEGCRKVMAGIHPDVTFVRDTDHKILPVETLRTLRSDAYIRPNEGARKVYVFADCGQIDERGQNLLLKTVEEGPPYAAFFFCADNSAALLPTLRSRCVEWKLSEAETGQEEDDSRAQAFCDVMARRQPVEIVEFFTGLEQSKMSREELSRFLEQCRERCARELIGRYEGAPAERKAACGRSLTNTQWMRTIDILETYRQECQWNVGVGHVLGALTAELEGIL